MTCLNLHNGISEALLLARVGTAFGVGRIVFFVVAKETSGIICQTHRTLLAITTPPLGPNRGRSAQ